MSSSVAIPAPASSGDHPHQSVAVVRGQRVIVECPAWCTERHAEHDELCLEDVAHVGDQAAVSAPVGVTSREDILAGHISQWTYTGETRPVFAFDATGSGEFSELSKVQARAELDRIAAHVERLRRVVDAMPDA
ncbi:DUF6907 domain-containing protein [Streptomyces reniochalinae]|uniref:Uncharacterized protein n=1 Tax=Streptomyces reniochalinae TaxID=2250578 RepID=A0A367EW19_9ACTN|nr:hypothetical protein [Streptomyces reniochalinae]RCG21775.1 hypothetical protein DQ392_08690 [Streptomyces reniochalinae]